jgi:hypothetical protein
MAVDDDVRAVFAWRQVRGASDAGCFGVVIKLIGFYDRQHAFTGRDTYGTVFIKIKACLKDANNQILSFAVFGTYEFSDKGGQVVCFMDLCHVCHDGVL